MTILIHTENFLLNFVFALTFVTTLTSWVNIAFPFAKYVTTMTNVGINLNCVCLGLAIGLRWYHNQYFPLSNLYESLLFLAWCIIFITILVQQKINSCLIRAVTLPVVLLIVAFSDMTLPADMQKVVPLVPALQSNWLMMHVSVMILSYASLIIGSLLSILFLILTYKMQFELKGNSIGLMPSRLSRRQLKSIPSTVINEDHVPYHNSNIQYLNLTQSLDNLSYRTIGFGFPLLTLGIIAGAVWANEAWGSYWSWDPKETWSLITWLVFAGYLHTRFNKAWYGRKPAILAAIGFVVIWVCYLGVNFLGKGLHSYGWIS